MTATLPLSRSIVQTQNTAPVYEYRCLFTHDVRRKQKRWQDGRLKYHTFNKRLMLYDDTQNYIEDTHWKEDCNIEVHEEVTFDSGLIVTVGEQVGSTQTDLRPLFERDRKHINARAGNADTRTGVAPARAARNGSSTDAQMVLGGNKVDRQSHGQIQKHRSLAALLGASSRNGTGQMMIPAQSPYEIRHQNDENKGRVCAGSHSKKKMKTGAPWAVTKTTSSPVIETPRKVRTAGKHEVGISHIPEKSARLQAHPVNQQRLTVKPMVDLTSESDNTMPLSDLTSLSFSKGMKPALQVSGPTNDAHQPKPLRVLRSPSPIPTRSLSPPISTKNSVRHIDVATVPAPIQTKVAAQTPVLVKKTKHLRIAKTQRPKMMLFQPKTVPQAKAIYSERQSERMVGHVSHSRLGASSDSIAFETASTSADMTKRRAGSITPTFVPDADLRCDFNESELSRPFKRRKELTRGKSVKATSLRKDQFRRVRSENDLLTEISDAEEDFPPLDDTTVSIPGRTNRAKQVQESSLSKTSKAGSDKKSLRRSHSDDGADVRSMKVRALAAPKSLGKSKEQGPWTVEAEDIFIWRPPDWEERLREKAEMAQTL